MRASALRDRHAAGRDCGARRDRRGAARHHRRTRRCAFRRRCPDKRDGRREALPLGVADKVFLSVERAEDLPVETRLFAATRRTETGGYTLRPFGRPLIDGYFGGPFARALERAEGGFAAFAIEEICAALGNDMRKRLHPIVESAWARDPWALGAYSYGSEGAQAARAALAAPVERAAVLRRRALLGCGFLHRARGVSHRREGRARGGQGACSGLILSRAACKAVRVEGWPQAPAGPPCASRRPSARSLSSGRASRGPVGADGLLSHEAEPKDSTTIAGRLKRCRAIVQAASPGRHSRHTSARTA